MKNKLNKLSTFILLLILITPSCVKERKGAADFSGLQPVAEILLSGKAYFGKANLLVNPTDATPIEREIIVNIASKGNLEQDVTVALDVSDEERVNYNATITNPDEKFFAMTSNQYSFPQKTVTIKASERLAKIKVTFYQDKIDPTKSWMLPVVIKTVSNGINISGNNAVVYFNVIGNPIAGAYTWDFTRWNNNTGTGTPNGASFTGESTVFVPVSPTSIEVASGYFIQPRYVLSFINNAGVLSNFKLKINDKDNEALAANSVTLTEGPTILIADPVNKHYKFNYVVWNGAAFRYLIDEFYQ